MTKSENDIPNTHARILTLRTAGDALDILSKYTTEIKSPDGMKFYGYVLNTPFVKTLDDNTLFGLQMCINGVCLNISRGFAKCSPKECYYIDNDTLAWYNCVKYDINEEENCSNSFSTFDVLDKMHRDLNPIDLNKCVPYNSDEEDEHDRLLAMIDDEEERRLQRS